MFQVYLLYNRDSMVYIKNSTKYNVVTTEKFSEAASFTTIEEATNYLANNVRYEFAIYYKIRLLQLIDIEV